MRSETFGIVECKGLYRYKLVNSDAGVRFPGIGVVARLLTNLLSQVVQWQERARSRHLLGTRRSHVARRRIEPLRCRPRVRQAFLAALIDLYPVTNL
jgi:hypothetical protein